MKKTYCDICKKEITYIASLIDIEYYKPNRVIPDRIRLELCEEHQKELKKLIKEFTENAS